MPSNTQPGGPPTEGDEGQPAARRSKRPRQDQQGPNEHRRPQPQDWIIRGKWRGAPDWIIRGAPGGRRRRPTSGKKEQAAPDWIIRGRTSTEGRNPRTGPAGGTGGAPRTGSSGVPPAEGDEGQRATRRRKRPWTGSSGAERARKAATPGLDHPGDVAGRPGPDHPGCPWRKETKANERQEGASGPGLDHPGQNEHGRPQPEDWTSRANWRGAPDWIIRGAPGGRRRRPTSGKKEQAAPDWIIRGRTSTEGRNPRSGLSGGSGGAPRTGSSGVPPAEGDEGQRAARRSKRPQTGSSGAERARKAATPRLDFPGEVAGRPGLDHPGCPRRKETKANERQEGASGPGLDHPGQNEHGRPQPQEWIIRGKWRGAPDWIIRGAPGGRRRRPTSGKKEQAAPDWIIRGRTSTEGRNPRTGPAGGTRGAPRTGSSGVPPAEGDEGQRAARRSKRPRTGSSGAERTRKAATLGRDHRGEVARRPGQYHPGSPRRKETEAKEQQEGASGPGLDHPGQNEHGRPQPQDWSISGKWRGAPDWIIRGARGGRRRRPRSSKKEQAAPDRIIRGRTSTEGRNPRTGSSGGRGGAPQTGSSGVPLAEGDEGQRAARKSKRPRTGSSGAERARKAATPGQDHPGEVVGRPGLDDPGCHRRKETKANERQEEAGSPGQDHPGQNEHRRPQPQDWSISGKWRGAPDWIIRGAPGGRRPRPRSGKKEQAAPVWIIWGRKSTEGCNPGTGSPGGSSGTPRTGSSGVPAAEGDRGQGAARRSKQPRTGSSGAERARKAATPGLDHPGQNEHARPQPQDWINRGKWRDAPAGIIRGGPGGGRRRPTSGKKEQAAPDRIIRGRTSPEGRNPRTGSSGESGGAPRTGSSGVPPAEGDEGQRATRRSKRPWTGSSGAEQARKAATPGLDHPGEVAGRPGLDHPGCPRRKETEANERQGGASGPGLDHPGQNEHGRPQPQDWIIQGKVAGCPGLDHPGCPRRKETKANERQEGASGPGLDHPGQNEHGRPQPQEWIIRGKWRGAPEGIVRGCPGGRRRRPKSGTKEQAAPDRIIRGRTSTEGRNPRTGSSWGSGGAPRTR